jgi:predicted TPR repeat methyltransferase
VSDYCYLKELMNIPAANKTQKIFNKAMSAYQKGNSVEAEKLLKKIIRNYPRHLDAHFLLGNLHAINGRNQLALSHLTLAAEIKPDSYQVQNNLGNVYRALKKLPEALSCYQRALSYQPNFLSALENIGHTCESLSKNQEAIDYFNQALALSPNNVELMFSLAKVQIKENNTEKAITLLNRCQELGSSQAEQINIMLAQLGDTDLPERYPDAMTLLTYKDKAESWDQDIHRNEHQYFGPKLIEKTLKNYSPEISTLSVLDLGCGTGACGEFLHKIAEPLVGVDLSPNMLAVAKQKNLYDELISAELTDYLKNSSLSFDLITAAGVFILIGSLIKPFQLVAQHLEPEGLFILTLYKGEDNKGESKQTKDGVSLRHNLHFAHNITHIKKSALAAGLSIEVIEEVIHETDNNQPQAGFIVLLRKNST